MFKYISMSAVSATWIGQCPNIICSDQDVATDEDDWCLRINLDTEIPAKSTIQTRQCIGETKPFCDWGIPGNVEKSVWPYSIEYLLN